MCTKIIQEITETRKIKLSPQGCFETVQTTYREKENKKEPQILLRPFEKMDLGSSITEIKLMSAMEKELNQEETEHLNISNEEHIKSVDEDDVSI